MISCILNIKKKESESIKIKKIFCYILNQCKIKENMQFPAWSCLYLHEFLTGRMKYRFSTSHISCSSLVTI